MKKSLKRNIILVLIAIVVIIQFIPVNRENPPLDPIKDFIAVSGIDAESATLLKSACYDCHSNESKYPWYSYVAPVSFLVANHIEEGREELNFSEWANYSGKKMDHKLEEASEALTEGWMPLKDYKLMHAEARLTDAQRKDLASVINMVRAGINPSSSSESTEVEHSDDD
jgi:hypothetical protein